MKRAFIIITVLAAVFLGGAYPAQGQQAASAPASPEVSSSESSAMQEIYQRWARIRGELEKKDFEGAQAGLKELEGRCLDMGITSFESLSASMVRQGNMLLDAREVGGAMALFDSAIRISPNYPAPYVAKGWGYLAQDKLKALTALDEFREGFTKSLNDFWWPFFYTGNKFTSLLFTLSVLFSLFGLFMAARYTPLLAHDVSETAGRPELEYMFKYAILPGFFIVVLLILGYWWAVSAVLLSLWVYFDKREKTLAIAFFALLILMPDVMTYFAKFAQAGGNRLLWAMDGANKGRAGEGAKGYLKHLLDKEPDNEAALMSLAEIKKKEGDYNGAEVVYNKLVVLRPDSEIYLNNLGNIHFLKSEMDEAIKDYSAAARSDPDKASPYFNLSQAYGEKLMFTERDNADLRAREVDPARVIYLRERSGATPLRMVFDEPIPVRMFWAIAFGSQTGGDNLSDMLWSTSVKVLPLRGARAAGLAFILLAFAVDVLRRNVGYAHFCQKCGKVSCRKCQKPYYNKALCAECHQIFVKLEGVEAKDRLRKILEAREKQRKQGILHRILSLILPGSGHFLAGHPLRGFMFMGIFVFLIKDIFFGHFYEVPYDFTLPFLRPDTMAMALVLAVFYVAAQVDTQRIIK